MGVGPVVCMPKPNEQELIGGKVRYGNNRKKVRIRPEKVILGIS